MLSFLKKVFRIKTSELEAKLHPVPECTYGGVGEIELETWNDGTASLEASIKHAGIPQGTVIEFYWSGQQLASLNPAGGYGKTRVQYTEMQMPPQVQVGDEAEIRVGGQTLYRGQFRPD